MQVHATRPKVYSTFGLESVGGKNRDPARLPLLREQGGRPFAETSDLRLSHQSITATTALGGSQPPTVGTDGHGKIRQ